MLKSEIQHQYWITKKTVQRKFGSKEDACIVSSDAELDAKIELFKSIAESCNHLHRLIDIYQERLCVLAQEETALGKFLKETGKCSTTSGKSMSTTGKSISYCGQQRMQLRAPLLRLHHEVETFRGRAIADTHSTIQAMERERTQYRAALSWMKSASAQLDPDTGRGLDKFRKAQNHVRVAKEKFDRLTLDCLQKIDLLAAARCNMFSHALVAYQNAMLQFATKTSETFKLAISSLDKEPHYSFTILKELTQGDDSPIIDNDFAEDEKKILKDTEGDLKAIDSDQMLFFKDEYTDEKQSNIINKNNTNGFEQLINVSQPNTTDMKSTITELLTNIDGPADKTPTNKSIDLLGLSAGQTKDNNDFSDFMSDMNLTQQSFMPSQLLLDDFNIFNNLQSVTQNAATSTGGASAINEESKPLLYNESPKQINSIMNLFTKSTIKVDQKLNDSDPISAASLSAASSSSSSSGTKQRTAIPMNKERINRKDKSSWFQLFAELDPLANPESMEKKICENINNIQSA